MPLEVFISKEVKLIGHTCQVLCGSKVFINETVQRISWALQLCSRSCC